MSSSGLVPCVLAAAFAACGPIDAPLQQVRGQATATVLIHPDVSLADGTSFWWTLPLRPAGSQAAPPTGQDVGTFVPDLRGTYLSELWIRDGVSDALAERFEIGVIGAPPIPRIAVAAQAAVGSTVTADGSQSASPEGRMISFHWELASRPRDSTASLAATDEPTTTVVPDVAGDYVLALAVFDGELWSTLPATSTIHAQ